MSSNLIGQPYPIILNPYGGGGSAKPAANAEFHVGEIDKDPIQYPRTDLAYKDESGTERLITSPIYTNNSGAFVASKNSSTIIQPYMKDGTGYSVLITGRRGEIYSSKHFGDPGNIDDVLQEKLPEYTAIEYASVADMIEGNPANAIKGSTVKTKGYYSPGDGGAATYDIAESLTPDECTVFTLDNGLFAKLRLSIDGYADIKQVGVKVFSSTSDSDFKEVDSGVIINKAIASYVIGLRSNDYGVIHSETQIVDDKGFYFEFPTSSEIDKAEEKSLKIVFDKDTVFSQSTAPFTVKSGVRKGGIKGLIIKEGAGATFGHMFDLGDAKYEDDTKNIISNYNTDSFYTQGGDFGIFTYQHFNCKFVNTNPRDYRRYGWFNEEGGTSIVWERCLPLSSKASARGFVWNPNSERQGHVYSTMIDCCPQLCPLGAYMFRNCSITMVSCAQEFCGGNLITFIGSGSYTVSNFTSINRNSDKPDTIYHVRPTNNGRFGATLGINGTSQGVTGFSGDKVQFMTFGDQPASVLSTTRWDISNNSGKCDPTSCLDFETWRSGYYYNTFAVLKQQLEVIETYTRSGQNTANIPIDLYTRHTITGDVTTSAGTIYITLEVDTGNKSLTSASRVNILETALADTTNRGRLMHIDSGQDTIYSTGNVYLRSFHKAGVDMFIEFNSGSLRVEFENNGSLVGQTGIWTITKRRSAMR